MLSRFSEIFKTIKQAKESKLFLNSFICKGNGKLKDYDDKENNINYRYAQWNLRARTTCPYHTKDCYKFCYARRDERHTSVRENRDKSFAASMREDFSDCMIHTILTVFRTSRYAEDTMILRIHESGDFYNLAYMKKWIKVFNCFSDFEQIIFCFYTKCFIYLLSLSDEEKTIFRKLTDCGRIACSLSLDESTTKEQLALAMKVKELFPNVNIYYAVKDVNSIAHDSVCECKDCAKCGECPHACGKTIACKIH